MNLEVEGLKLIGHQNHGDCEAVDYETPSGTPIFVAKDAIGVHICRKGTFWPSVAPFPTMEDAIACLKRRTQEAIKFFDERNFDK